MKAGLNRGIQGLRGISILLVLLNHAGVPGFAGGYVGVDIFFVISGYLIGGLLWREGLREGQIDIWGFYARRIRRLFPANALLVIAVGLASLFLFAPQEWSETFSAMRAAQLYVINLWFTSRATDYFGGQTAANPFLHLWSLAVEEQFYLLWPWVVVLCLKGRAERFTGRLKWATVAVAAASLAACVAATWASQPLAFFNMPFRMWEFAAGIGLAIRPIVLPPRLRVAVDALAVAGLLLVTLFMDEHRQFPGLWAVLPVLCAQGMLLAATHPEPGLLQRLLNWAPLARLGDCSYSVYLWHWPVLIFAAVLRPQHDAGLTAVLLVLGVAAGWASWHGVEERWRTRWAAGWQPARFVVMSIGLAIGLALLTGIPRNWPGGDGQLEIARQQKLRPDAVRVGCHASIQAVDLPDCFFGATQGEQTVVLWGDSHAVNWFPALEALAKQHGWRLVSLTKSGCPSVDMPVWNEILRRSYSECAQWRESMLHRIIGLQPTLVVLANLATSDADAAWQAGLDRTLSQLEAAGLAAAVMRDTPRVPVDVPTCAARAQWRGQDINERCAFLAGDRRPWQDGVARAQAEALSRHPKALPIDMSDAFCSGGRCNVADGGRLRFYDDNHLTPPFSASLGEAFAARLAAAAAASGNTRIAGLLASAKPGH